jgi:hypothetical protein
MSGIIEARKGFAPAPAAGFPATSYFWFRLTKFGAAFRRCPAFLRKTFLSVVWLKRWDHWRRIASVVRRLAGAASLLVATYKGWQSAWLDVVLALAVFVAIISGGRSRPRPLAETIDT